MTLILCLLIVGAPSIEAHFTGVAPRIDGSLEPLWQTADSARSFTQLTPDFGRPSTESTTAYLLYDRDNVYVAFRCFVRDLTTRRAQMSGTSDGVRLYFDTFGDNNSCYGFSVSASGVEQTYRLTDDGATVEPWDGVWRSAVRLEPWGYGVELAIPFRTLRYPQAVTSWGIDFGRYTVARGEKSYWVRHNETGVRVSEMGRIASIRTPPAGLHLELYPVGLFRYQYDGDSRYEPSAGLDAAWLPTPTANLQLTTFPDFAQIEADPYQVNLSRYELWLPEKRPFFVEAAENFGGRGDSLQLFYSRRIGKPLPDGKVVPVLGGAKYTDRLGRFSLGTLAAVTAATEYKVWRMDSLGNWYLADALEPLSIYSIASLRRLVLGNSQVGLTYAGKDNERFSNHGAAFDATMRQGDFNARINVAGSQDDDILGYGITASSHYNSSKLNAYAAFRQIAPEFNMNGIGFTDWRGQSFEAGAGPVFYSRGPFRQASVTGYAGLSRDWDYPADARAWDLGLTGSAEFRDQSYAGAWFGPSRSWYFDLAGYHDYTGFTAGGRYGTDATRAMSAALYASYVTASYNYRRFVLAPNADAELDLAVRLGDRVSAQLANRAIFEFEPGGRFVPREDVTLVLTPRIDVAITPKMTIAALVEGVRTYDVSNARPYSSLYGSLLYAWTIRPRSTLYLALNQRFDDGAGEFAATGTIAVVKLRYLFVF